jgi:hypothetical protein
MKVKIEGEKRVLGRINMREKERQRRKEEKKAAIC